MLGMLMIWSAILGPPAQKPAELPFRGLHLMAPAPGEVQEFSQFIRAVFPKEGVNLLVLEIDYGFQFKKRPEMANPERLSADQLKAIAAACRESGVRLIPQINLLGHQSWAKNTDKLLTAHPELDETPGKFKNNEGIYCRSYCPLHPQVHEVVFDLIDEVLEASGADALHVGMDEVFILADKDCPRCAGKSTADLFAGEVNALHAHLKTRKAEMWMWGDRFLDGRENGLGEWEAATNGTPPAIEKVPKDIVICDWHYEKAEPTAALFALQGFRVLSCPWRQPEVALRQLDLLRLIQSGANPKLQDRPLGMLQTSWGSVRQFMDAYNGKESRKESKEVAACFKALFEKMRTYANKSD